MTIRVLKLVDGLLIRGLVLCSLGLTFRMGNGMISLVICGRFIACCGISTVVNILIPSCWSQPASSSLPSLTHLSWLSWHYCSVLSVTVHSPWTCMSVVLVQEAWFCCDWKLINSGRWVDSSMLFFPRSIDWSNSPYSSLNLSIE